MKIKTLSKETETIASIANTDTLTGLKNCYALCKDLDRLIFENTPFLLIFMDLDNLKSINDKYNHMQGDTYLSQFAKTVSTLLGKDGITYRFAGDEFLSILTSNITSFNPEAFKEEVSNLIKINVPFLGFSVGLAYFPNDGLTVDELIDLADKHMYKDKRVIIDSNVQIDTVC